MTHEECVLSLPLLNGSVFGRDVTTTPEECVRALRQSLARTLLQQFMASDQARLLAMRIRERTGESEENALSVGKIDADLLAIRNRSEIELTPLTTAEGGQNGTHEETIRTASVHPRQ